MSIIESRLKDGTLTFGGGPGSPSIPEQSFACQATNVRVTPSYAEEGDPAKVLCGDEIGRAKTETWQLQGTSIQDFDDAQGFLAFCYEHAMTDVPFSWVPNKKTAPTWAGRCTVVALEEGGDVDARLVTNWAFDCVGRPTRTAPGGAGPDKGAAAPGDTFAAEGTVTASDAGNAAKLAGLGYVADPTSAWTTGQRITLGSYAFHWDGSAWAAGAVA